MGSVNPRGNKFQADIKIPNGARLRPTFDTFDQADTWLRTVEGKIKNGVDITQDIAQNTRAVSMNLRELAEEVLNRHWRGCKSELSLWKRQGRVPETRCKPSSTRGQRERDR